MKLVMRLLGWKRLSRKRRVKLQRWKSHAKKCVAIVVAGIVTCVSIATVRNSVVVVSWVALAGMAAWLIWHVKQQRGEWGI